MKKAFFFLSLIVVFCISSGISQDNKKARELGEAELNKYVVQCGDNWYVKRLTRGPYELKRNGVALLKERTLSEADRLNGIEYWGVLEFCYYGPQREYGYISENNKGWSAWTEGNLYIDIWIQKKGGVWKVELTNDLFRGSTYVQISCEDVPGYKPDLSILSQIEVVGINFKWAKIVSSGENEFLVIALKLKNNSSRKLNGLSLNISYLLRGDAVEHGPGTTGPITLSPGELSSVITINTLPIPFALSMSDIDQLRNKGGTVILYLGIFNLGGSGKSVELGKYNFSPLK